MLYKAVRVLSIGLAAAVLSFASAAADMTSVSADEIDRLLRTVGSSDCNFIRNGKRYDAATAERHLRLKLRRGKRYVTTAETFIGRLASSSSMSRKPYYIDCPGEATVPSGTWLTLRLRELRDAAAAN